MGGGRERWEEEGGREGGRGNQQTEIMNLQAGLSLLLFRWWRGKKKQKEKSRHVIRLPVIVSTQVPQFNYSSFSTSSSDMANPHGANAKRTEPRLLASRLSYFSPPSHIVHCELLLWADKPLKLDKALMLRSVASLRHECRSF